MPVQTTQLVIGRGEIYFDPFPPGQMTGSGEIYIGNTPEFTTSRDVDTVQMFDSFDGQKIAIESPIIRETHTARFTTDHISMENLALWHGGDQTLYLQNRLENISETYTVLRGRFYQLGYSVNSPLGARGIESLTARKGSVSIPVSGNFEVDKINGRIGVLATAPDVENGDSITFTYERRDITNGAAIPSRRELFGALRFVSTNPVGVRKNFFYPFVKLMATGEIDLKGASWQTISFTVEAQRRNPLLDYLYVDEIVVFGPTVTEYAIEEISGISIDEFPYWEDKLNHLTNSTIPSHGY